MRTILLALLLLAAGLFSRNDARAAICPTTVNTNSDCGFIVTLGAGGTVTTTTVIGALPYDGGDDTLVGVINNSGSVYTGSFKLMGSGNGGGIFAFDGDGICTYTRAAYCSVAKTGYEGPLNTFTSINSAMTSGSIDFAGIGIASGATTFFSLESSPRSIINSGGLNMTGVPEPATLTILIAGLAGLALMRQRAR